MSRLECQVQLHVGKICVARAEAGRGPGLTNIIAGKEMAVTCFELRPARDGQPGNDGKFRADKTIVARVDAKAVAGRGGHAAPRSAGHGVEIVMSVSQPKSVAHERDVETGSRLEGQVDSGVLN